MANTSPISSLERYTHTYQTFTALLIQGFFCQILVPHTHPPARRTRPPPASCSRSSTATPTASGPTASSGPCSRSCSRGCGRRSRRCCSRRSRCVRAWGSGVWVSGACELTRCGIAGPRPQSTSCCARRPGGKAGGARGALGRLPLARGDRSGPNCPCRAPRAFHAPQDVNKKQDAHI